MADSKRRLNHSYSKDYKLQETLPFADFFVNQKLSILLVSYYPNTEIDTEKALLVVNAVNPIISNNNLAYGITDARAENLNISRKARQLYSDNPTLRLSKRHAVIVNRLSTRMLANFFIKIDKPVIETNVFNSVQTAENWLVNH